MIEIKVKLAHGAIMPTKAHDEDAGYDLFTPTKFTIGPGESAIVDTGVCMQIPKGYVGMIKSKSGLNVKFGMISEGVVDSGYTGHIIVKLRNIDGIKHKFEPGYKISQIVILPIPETKLVQVDSLEDTDRGDKGFGSSGN